MNVQEKMSLLSLLAYDRCNYRDLSELQDKMKAMLQGYDKTKESLAISEVCWGPVAKKPDGIDQDDVVSCALMYIVKHKATEPEYTLAIRGTNPGSVYSWVNLDFAVEDLKSWSDVLKDFGPEPMETGKNLENVKISKATYDALKIHVELKHENKLTVLDWIKQTINPSDPKKIKLNITGHSLGGVLSTTLALWLHEKLGKDKLLQYVDFHIHSFAGPTAGNQEFAKYTNDILKDKYICYINELDTVTHAWVEEKMNKEKLSNIYVKGGGAKPFFRFEKNFIAKLDNKSKDGGYTRLVLEEKDTHYRKIESKVKSVPLFGFPMKTLYSVQALYQHMMPYFVFSLSYEQTLIAVDVLNDLYQSSLKLIWNLVFTGSELEFEISDEDIEGLRKFIEDELNKQP